MAGGGFGAQRRLLLSLLLPVLSAAPASSQPVEAEDALDDAVPWLFDEAGAAVSQGVGSAKGPAASSLQSLRRGLASDSFGLEAGLVGAALGEALWTSDWADDSYIHLYSTCPGPPKDNVRIIGTPLGKVYNVSDSDCCRLCAAITICRSWYWGKEGEWRGICWLQSTSGTYVHNKFTVASDAVGTREMPGSHIGLLHALVLSVVLLLLAPAFLLWAVRRLACEPRGGGHACSPWGDPSKGFADTAREVLCAPGGSWPIWLGSLKFKDSRHEERYLRDQAAMMSRCIVPLALHTSFSTVLLSVLHVSHSGHAMLNQYVVHWGTVAGLLYTCSFLAVASLGLIMVWLAAVRCKGRICMDIELVVLCWATASTAIRVFFNDGFSIRTMFSASQAHLQPASALETDADVVLFVLCMNLYLNVLTPVRFCMMRLFGAVCLCFYLLKCVLLGSPEGATFMLVYGTSYQCLLGQMALPELKLLFVMAIMLFMVLVVKRHLELQQRKNFIYWIKAVDLQSNRIEESFEFGGPPGQEIHVARETITSIEMRLKKLLEHPVLDCVGLREEMQQLVNLARGARKNLADVDRLFNVDAKDALEHASFAAYRNHNELERYLAGGFNACISVNGASNGRLLGDLELADMSGTGSTVFAKTKSDYGTVVCESDWGKWLEGLGDRWDFNTLELARNTGGRSLLFVAEAAVVQAPWRDVVQGTTELAVRHFFRELHRRYLAKPYHNEAHAATVTHITLWLARRCGYMAGRLASNVERFSLVVAAMAHDVGHFGRSNNFLMSSRHGIAVIWNDQSVLENMHAAVATHLGEACGLFQGMPVQQQQQLRSNLIAIILSTDLKFHQENLRRFQHRSEAEDFLQPVLPAATGASDAMEKDALDRWAADKMMLSKLLIMSSDVGHACTPWDQHFHWSLRANLEFFEQGDAERRLGLPISPLCDRGSSDMVKGQCFFIDFVCKPLYNELQKVVPDVDSQNEMDEVLQQGTRNKGKWQTVFSNGEFDPIEHSQETCERWTPHRLSRQKKMPYAFTEEEDHAMVPVGTEQMFHDLFVTGLSIQTGGCPETRPASRHPGGTSPGHRCLDRVHRPHGSV